MRSLVLTSLFFLASVAGGDTTRLTAGSGSVVVLKGSSNVAAWQCRGKAIDALMVVATSPAHINEVIDRIQNGDIGPWMTDPSRGRFATPDFVLRVPVATFRCGNRVMEKDLRRALKATPHPNVEFSFRELRGAIRHDIDTGLFHAVITGDLSLAGETRTIELTVSAERLSSSRFRFRAELPLRMTDFGITPPTALFGAVKARDELKVRFDLTLEVAGRGSPP